MCPEQYRAAVHVCSTRRCTRLADPARHAAAAVQEHEKRGTKVCPPVVADHSACGRVSRGHISHAHELVVHVHRPLGVAWSTPAPR
eukprot:3777488-Prymnesium_polylepis.1